MLYFDLMLHLQYGYYFINLKQVYTTYKLTRGKFAFGKLGNNENFYELFYSVIFLKAYKETGCTAVDPRKTKKSS